MEELKIDIAVRLIKKSKKDLSKIHNSVGPDSSTSKSLKKAMFFLEDLEKEIVPQVKTSKSKILLVVIASLVPIVKLLKELLAEASKVLEQLF
jgi:hypothetical protein